MSWFPAVAMLAGTAMSAVGQIQQGQQKSAASEMNAKVAEMNAQAVRTSGAYEQQQIERAKRKMLSAQKTAYAKSGVVISEGSPLEVQADTATQYEMDINASKYNTAVQSGQYEMQARLDRIQGKGYQSAGYMGAATTLLTSFGNTNWGSNKVASSTPANPGIKGYRGL